MKANSQKVSDFMGKEGGGAEGFISFHLFVSHSRMLRSTFDFFSLIPHGYRQIND